jgi:hypothetical protein
MKCPLCGIFAYHVYGMKIPQRNLFNGAFILADLADLADQFLFKGLFFSLIFPEGMPSAR